VCFKFKNGLDVSYNNFMLVVMQIGLHIHNFVIDLV
jgi:hypothetical protein